MLIPGFSTDYVDLPVEAKVNTTDNHIVITFPGGDVGISLIREGNAIHSFDVVVGDPMTGPSQLFVPAR